MPSDEYKSLEKATRTNDENAVKSIIEKLEAEDFTAGELETEFDELPYTLIALAVARASPEILKRLLDFGFNPSWEIKGKHPLHVAAQTNKPLHAALLIKHGVDVNSLSSQSALTPLYVANERGSHETVQVLLQNGAQIDPQRPLDDKKITRSQLETLLASQSGDTLKLAELLLKNNYSPSIVGFTVNLTPFTTLDLSGVDLSDSVIQIDKADEVDFQAANLTNALVMIQNKPQTLKLNNANMRNAVIMGEASLKENLSKTQTLVCDFLYQNVSDRFKQKRLLSLYPNLNQAGVCFGLCVEYMRQNKAHDGNKSFINKLNKKTETRSDRFLERVSFFHQYNDPGELKTYPIDIKDIKNKQSLDKIYEQCDANFIELELTFSQKKDGGHAAILHRVGNRYQVYDPNFGKSPLLTQEEANEHLSALVKYYEKLFPGSVVALSVDDFEKRYVETIKNKPGAQNIKGF